MYILESESPSSLSVCNFDINDVGGRPSFLSARIIVLVKMTLQIGSPSALSAKRGPDSPGIRMPRTRARPGDSVVVYESRAVVKVYYFARISRRDNDYYFRARRVSLSLSLYARREEVGVSRISPYLTIDRRSKLLFASRWAGGPLSNSLLLSLSLSTILPSLFLSKRSLPKLFPGTKMRAHHRGRLLFCPRNSHFDQFEFFVGAATVDFTTETSSLLSPARRVLLSLSLPLGLSSLFLSLSLVPARWLPFSAISSLLLSRTMCAYVKSRIFHPTCSFRRYSDSLARSLMLRFRDVRASPLDEEGYSDGLLAGGGSDSWHSSVLRIAAEVPRNSRRILCVYERTERNVISSSGRISLAAINFYCYHKCPFFRTRWFIKVERLRSEKIYLI